MSAYATTLAPSLAVTRDALAVRMEDAALNATVVREQMLYDGWLVRWACAKARRARSINVIGPSVGALDEKLEFCRALYRRHELPLIFRLTSIGPDDGLDRQLHDRGLAALDETCVMSLPIGKDTAKPGAERPASGLRFEHTGATAFADITGQLRAYAPEHVQEHARRLSSIAMPCARIVARTADGLCAAAGMAVFDGSLAGIFDVVVHPQWRRRGYARALAQHLLALGHGQGAHTAYLQVEPTNIAARMLYGGLGFNDRYTYWYRAQQEN